MPKGHFFLLMSGLSFGAGVAFFALSGPLKRAMGRENREAADL